MSLKNKIAVVMGSTSDLKVMQPGLNLLKDCPLSVEVKIVSAHRTPEFMQDYAKNAQSQGIHLIIAGAGGAAHLPGMLASLTCLPIIGVPISSKTLKGLDSLLSIVQMPKGIPVATVGIDNSYNAALLALRLLALQNPLLKKKLNQIQAKQKKRSLQSNKSLKKIL